MRPQYIPLKEAAEILNVCGAALVTSKKYKPFYRKSDKDKKNAGFDINGFKYKEDLNTELIEKTKLLVEYLKHEESMTASEIGEVSGVAVTAISSLVFGLDVAFRVASSIKKKKPYHWVRFHKYYGWKI